MVTKKTLLVAITLTFCLTSILFMIRPTRSNPLGIGEYDPWIDLNDDGAINLLDAIMLSNRYATTGIPINKTSLLLDLLARIDALNTTVMEQQNIINTMNTTINNLCNTVIELQNTTEYLNTTVAYLNDTIIILNGTRGLGAPDYDSGWVNSPANSWVGITHNLNRSASDLLIYFIGRYWDGSVNVINQICYGTETYIYPSNDQYRRGAWWESHDNNTITIYNAAFPSENYNFWKNVRVIIWVIR